MSVCRFADNCDVYLIATGPMDKNEYRCCMCHLERKDVDLYSPDEVLVHLKKHLEAEHGFPFYAVLRLLSETLNVEIDSKTLQRISKEGNPIQQYWAKEMLEVPNPTMASFVNPNKRKSETQPKPQPIKAAIIFICGSLYLIYILLILGGFIFFVIYLIL